MELTLATLSVAFGKAPPEIRHSDQGLQYAATEFVNTLKQRNVETSMAAVGQAEENGYAERGQPYVGRAGSTNRLIWRELNLPIQPNDLERRQFDLVGGKLARRELPEKCFRLTHRSFSVLSVQAA